MAGGVGEGRSKRILQSGEMTVKKFKFLNLKIVKNVKNALMLVLGEIVKVQNIGRVLHEFLK